MVAVKALVKFYTLLGLPKVLQTDQGTNFMSKLFARVMKTLNITCKVSSPYHPESQGELEWFYQLVKVYSKKILSRIGMGCAASGVCSKGGHTDFSGV